ncbi:MAG: DNA oxidative demethylase AlkB [Myxococcales bacterium]|nr:DNA oxidative demethylase AlkB [Myxococcales bacterium]
MTERQLDLFGPPARPTRVDLATGAALLPGFALAAADPLRVDIAAIAAESPFRHMATPGGFTMSVAMTNCGALGWITDRAGYRYAPIDPLTHRPWPAIPPRLLTLAGAAADRVGFPGFTPDACLVNLYAPGARMTLHQDKNERDFTAPIVSVSLGLPATFLFGGDDRSDKAQRVPLVHGDVVVWGGPARLRFHGVLPVGDLKRVSTPPAPSAPPSSSVPSLDAVRINLTLRRAG